MMSVLADEWSAILVLAAGGLVVMDGWLWLRARWLGLPMLDYGRVGLWMAGWPRGIWRLSPEAGPARVGHRIAGWALHLMTAVVFAALFLMWTGPAWLEAPALWPALVFGAVTVLVPFLTMMPGLGSGWAGHRLPRPWRARKHSLVTHLAFGLGLFAGGWGLQIVEAFR
jgi:hypothetical protein